MTSHDSTTDAQTQTRRQMTFIVSGTFRFSKASAEFRICDHVSDGGLIQGLAFVA
jgi:hypothetical protein